MNLAALLTSVQAKGYSSDQAVPITAALNSVNRTVCGQQRWPFLEKQDRTSLSTVVGTSAYPLSVIADLTHVDAVRIEVPGWTPGAETPEAHDLENMEPQDFRDLEHVDRDYATPVYWSLFNQQLHFYPAPDQIYTVVMDYIMTPPDLVNPTDTPLLPAVYHDILTWGAVSELAYRERDWLGRNFALQLYEERLKSMKDEYQLRQRQTSSHVKDSGYWGTQRPYQSTSVQGW